MKKQVFVGRVNGQMFNDVKSYNEAVAKVLESGESLSAESKTETVDVCDKCGLEQCICDKEEVEWLPGFEDYCYEYYLDEVVSKDPEANVEKIDEWSKELTKTFDTIQPQLRYKSEKFIKEYIEDLNDVISCLDEDMEDNKKAMDKLQTKLKVLEQAEDVIYMTKRWYERMLEEAESCQNLVCQKNQDKCKCDCETPCEQCTCREKEAPKTSEPVSLDPFKELYKMIFG